MSCSKTCSSVGRSNRCQSIELGERIVGFDPVLTLICLGDERRAGAVPGQQLIESSES